MGIRDWLAIIVIIFIVLILLDGFRRKWQERKTRIRVKLEKNIPPADDADEHDVLTKSELPNGGARIKPRGSQEVPVLMDSVDIDSDDIAEYGEPDGDDEDWEDDWDDDGDAAGIAGTAGDPNDDSFEDWDDEDDADDGDYEDYDEEDREPAFGNADEAPWVGGEPPAAAEAGVTARTAGERGGKAGSKRESGKHTREERIEPTFGDEEFTFARDDQGELDLEHHDLIDHDEEAAGDEEDGHEPASEVIIINVMARTGTALEGSRLLPVLMKQGMRLGDMSIFHRHADNSGKGPVMFSMANMLKPGTFTMSEMESFATPGVSFFMQLPNKLGNMQCFEQMLKTAQAVRDELDAVLKDENRSVFTRQTIEHSRQRIRDFELEMLARK